MKGPFFTETNESEPAGDGAAAACVPSVGIFRADKAGNYVYVNQAWCDITGLSPDEAVADGWQKAVHEDDRTRLLARWVGATISRSDSFVAEYRIRSGKSAEKWVCQHAEAMREAGGNITSYIGRLIDITDRKLAELKLRELEDYLRRSS